MLAEQRGQEVVNLGGSTVLTQFSDLFDAFRVPTHAFEEDIDTFLFDDFSGQICNDILDLFLEIHRDDSSVSLALFVVGVRIQLWVV